MQVHELTGYSKCEEVKEIHSKERRVGKSRKSGSCMSKSTTPKRYSFVDQMQ